ncbi:glycoside hydrolase family 2 protein [Gemmiger qucibialis]
MLRHARNHQNHEGWEFTGPDGTTTTVDLPHTWNARDGQDGGNDYWRGTCIYRTHFAAPQFNTASHQVWIQFDGVNASAHVVLNGSPVCNHDGGYSTFRANITELLRDENELTVEVDNSKNDRVYPQKADFTFYGGIYRDVSLMVVSKNHFTLDYFGGPGIRITPTVQGADASVQVTTWHDGEGEVSIELLDAAGNTVATGKGPDITLTIFNAHLWNGVKDPYLYSCKARLVVNGTVEDETTTRFGVRSFKVDPKKGFFLNGKSYPLHGVSRHQDRKGLGNAITREMHDEDMALIKEIGANTIRLAHYQHDQYFYDLCDEVGMVVWAEIPYISEHMPNGRENTISQMKELIIQNYNHPCIVCWGVSNEITISTKDKKDMLDNHRQLNDLCHEMDKTRLTTLACYAMCGPFNRSAHITDMVSWNLYLAGTFRALS